MENIQLKSGRTLGMTMAPFSVGSKLYRTIAKELREVKLELPAGTKSITDLDIGVAKDAILQLIASSELEAVVFECFNRCTLDGVKVTRETFESEEGREDYFPAALEVVKYNLTPFFRGLDFKLLVPGGPPVPGQK